MEGEEKDYALQNDYSKSSLWWGGRNLKAKDALKVEIAKGAANGIGGCCHREVIKQLWVGFFIGLSCFCCAVWLQKPHKGRRSSFLSLVCSQTLES